MGNRRVKGEGVGNRRADSLRSLESGTDKGWVFLTRTHLICHCEEHGDVAIWMRLSTRRRTAVVTATGLPGYARNDTGGMRGLCTSPVI